MDYGKTQNEIRARYLRWKDHYPVEIVPNNTPYFHVYMFRYNEKRYYKNKLTLIDPEVTKYLGVTIKDKTDSHWKVEPKAIKPLPKKRKTKSYTDDEKRFLRHGGDLTIQPYSGKYISIPQEFAKLSDNEKFCCYCECKLTLHNITREHLLPKTKGGKGRFIGHQNIRPCCKDCNTEKGGMLLREYIGALNILWANLPQEKAIAIQRKIVNANKLAKELDGA